MPETPRPEGCPDETCKIFRWKAPVKKGSSSWCCGRLAEGRADAEDGFLHLNDLSLCLFDGRAAPAARLFTRTQDLMLLGFDLLTWSEELESLPRKPPPKDSEETIDPVEYF